MRKLFLSIALLVCVAGLAFAGLTTDQERELNKATPGTDKVSLGTILDKMTYDGGVQTITPSTSLSLNYAIAKVTTTALRAIELEDGSYPGQRLKVILSTDGGDLQITPTTSTSVNTVTLDDAADFVDMQWINSTDGWTVTGQYGVAITQ